MRGSLFCRHLGQIGWNGLKRFGWALCLAGLFAGCQPTYPDLIVGADGTPIRLEAINRILDDPDLDDAQRRQALRDLGIADEEFIEILIRGL